MKPTDSIRGAGLSVDTIVAGLQRLGITPTSRISPDDLNDVIVGFKSMKVTAGSSSSIDGVSEEDMNELIAGLGMLRLKPEKDADVDGIIAGLRSLGLNADISGSSTSTSTSINSAVGCQRATTPASPDAAGPTTPAVLFPLGARPWGSPPKPCAAVDRRLETVRAATKEYIAAMADPAERMQWMEESVFLMQRVRARGIGARDLWGGVLSDYIAKYPDQNIW